MFSLKLSFNISLNDKKNKPLMPSFTDFIDNSTMKLSELSLNRRPATINTKGGSFIAEPLSIPRLHTFAPCVPYIIYATLMPRKTCSIISIQAMPVHQARPFETNY